MYPHLPSLRALRCFEAVARLQSMTRAAAELNMTQGAVSRQIANLEEVLGCGLFQRERQRVHLNREGMRYLPTVRECLLQLERGTRELRGDYSARLRIGIEPSLASRWLIPRLPEFARDNPGLDIQLVTDMDLLYGEPRGFDIGILFGDGHWPGFDAAYLMPDTLIAVCSENLLQRFGSLQAPADALRFPLLHHTATPSSTAAWLAAAGLAENDIDELPGARLPNFSLVVEFALQEMGLAIVPEYLVAKELREGALRQASDFALELEDAYYLVIPHRGRAVAGVMPFARWLQADQHRRGEDNRKGYDQRHHAGIEV